MNTDPPDAKPECPRTESANHQAPHPKLVAQTLKTKTLMPNPLPLFGPDRSLQTGREGALRGRGFGRLESRCQECGLSPVAQKKSSPITMALPCVSLLQAVEIASRVEELVFVSGGFSGF